MTLTIREVEQEARRIAGMIQRARTLGLSLALDDVVEELSTLSDLDVDDTDDCEDCQSYDRKMRSIRSASYSLDSAKNLLDCTAALARIMSAIGSADTEALAEASDFVARIRSLDR